MSRPCVLLVASDVGFTPRLAPAFVRGGFVVKVVCPRRHPFRAMRAVQRSYFWSSLHPARSLASAIHHAKPDLIVPCTEDALEGLVFLYRNTQDKCIRDSLERSLGPIAGEPGITSRVWLMQEAAAAGIRLPETSVVSDLGSMRAWLDQRPFPIVLKADGSNAGSGVRISSSWTEAEQDFNSLSARYKLPRVTKRLLANADFKPLLNLLQGRKPTISVQRCVQGRDANIAFACWKGSVIASITLEVVCAARSNGPATVVRLKANSEMLDAAVRLASHLQLSGIYGMDFILEEDSEIAYLIEINARAPQGSHLALGAGRDLTAAMHAALTGDARSEQASPVQENGTIAYFPSEWRRDPESPYLENGYHDVPWREVSLMARLIRSGEGRSLIPSYEKWSQVYSRMFLWFRRRPFEPPAIVDPLASDE